MAETSGIGVTRGSEVGANFLNFCNAKQERDGRVHFANGRGRSDQWKFGWPHNRVVAAEAD